MSFEASRQITGKLLSDIFVDIVFIFPSRAEQYACLFSKIYFKGLFKDQGRVNKMARDVDVDVIKAPIEAKSLVKVKNSYKNA